MVQYSEKELNELLDKQQNNQERTLKTVYNVLKQKQYNVNKTQKIFLEKYHLFTFTFVSPRNASYCEELIISPLLVVASILRYVVEDYEAYTGKKLLIVDEIAAEDMSIFLADDGTFYGGNSDILLDFGRRFASFLYKVTHGIPVETMILDQNIELSINKL